MRISGADASLFNTSATWRPKGGEVTIQVVESVPANRLTVIKVRYVPALAFVTSQFGRCEPCNKHAYSAEPKLADGALIGRSTVCMCILTCIRMCACTQQLLLRNPQHAQPGRVPTISTDVIPRQTIRDRNGSPVSVMSASEGPCVTVTLRVSPITVARFGLPSPVKCHVLSCLCLLPTLRTRLRPGWICRHLVSACISGRA